MTLAEQIHARICEARASEVTETSNLDAAIIQLVGELAPLTPRDEAVRITAEVKARIDLSLIHI